MDLNIIVPSGDDTQRRNSRYLPTYDAANTQYTLRLPTYRSSYIRRFHPYARIAHFIEEHEMDGDEGMLLELRALGDRVEVLAEEIHIGEVPVVVVPVAGLP